MTNSGLSYIDTLFITRIIISFIVSGLWIASATLLAERFGTRAGGLITNLPSNILISLIFVAIINSPAFVVAAVPGIPIGMAINTIFLFIFILLLKHGLFLATAVSLLTWFGMAAAAVSANFSSLLYNTIFYIFITLVTYIILVKIAKIPPAKRFKKKYTKLQILVRAIFAGSIVSSVIIVSKFFNPYFVGIFSTFPAVLLSTMIILTKNQDIHFARATGKVLILSSSNIVVYGISVYYFYNLFDIVSGTVFSFLSALLWVVLLGPVTRRLDRDIPDEIKSSG